MRDKTKLLTLLLLFWVAMLFVLPAYGQSNDFVINGADAVTNFPAFGSSELNTLTANVQDRFILNYANAKYVYTIIPFAQELNPLLQQIQDRIIIQYANGNKDNKLSYPAGMINDTTQPTVSEVAYTVAGPNTVMITWVTDEYATSSLSYGTTSGSYSQTASDPLLSRTHAVTLTNLTANQTYYYRISGSDRSGNGFQTAEFTFTLNSTPPTNTPIVVPSPTNTPIPPPTATNTPLSPMATSTPVPPAGAPTISEIRPNQGRADVVNTINIYGAGFIQGATVRLDTAVLTATYIKATQFQAEIAAGLAPGLYDVTLTNPNGASVTLSDAYTVLGADNDDLTGYDYELWVDPAAPHANAQAKVGLVVHRQGGKQVVTNVVVHFYVGDPLAGGTLIGAGTVALLSPRSSANTTGVTWTPPAAGAYTIYAVIDPSNTIPEANEANNLIHHTVTVRTPAVDQLSPHVDSFAINSGALETAGRAVLLNTTASDPAPGTVASLFFIEYEYSQGANQWVPAQISPWLDYPTTRANYGWTLLPSIGMHYLQAWAMDRAGNISLLPYKAFITYNPPLHRVGQDQVQVYRYELQAGEQVLVRVQPNSGDPDLYVWAPDHATRPPWVSNLRTGVDDVSFVAPVAGVYQVEVYGFSAAEYQLVLDQRVAQAVAAQVHGGVDPNKSQFSQPRVPVGNEPAQQYALPPSGQTVQAVYLPIVQR